MFTISQAENMATVRELWREYWAELGLPDDFQGFDDELRGLPGRYSAPQGALGLAWAGESAAGTVALRPLEMTGDASPAAEAKRLYVRPAWRRRGLGHALVVWLVEQAKERGYRALCCDTLPAMTGPIRLYTQMGFRLLDTPYSESPTPGAVYLRKDL